MIWCQVLSKDLFLPNLREAPLEMFPIYLAIDHIAFDSPPLFVKRAILGTFYKMRGFL